MVQSALHIYTQHHQGLSGHWGKWAVVVLSSHTLTYLNTYIWVSAENGVPSVTVIYLLTDTGKDWSSGGPQYYSHCWRQRESCLLLYQQHWWHQHSQHCLPAAGQHYCERVWQLLKHVVSSSTRALLICFPLVQFVAWEQSRGSSWQPAACSEYVRFDLTKWFTAQPPVDLLQTTDWVDHIIGIADNFVCAFLVLAFNFLWI